VSVIIWRKPVLTYAVSVVSLTASVNSVNTFLSHPVEICYIHYKTVVGLSLR